MKKEVRAAEQARYLMQEEEDIEDTEMLRHSYGDEQALLSCVRTGDLSGALALSERMFQNSGRLSVRAENHLKYLAIVGIVLSSRAAIEGGLSPEKAYLISGYYIQKCDTIRNPDDYFQLHNETLSDLISNMTADSKRSRSSSYTESAKYYIGNHYREKIYLEDIASYLGISPSYLSRKFKADTGKRLQDYIVEVRVQRAANMLRYSELSLSAIAEYVHFPSQSYFGKVFKQAMNMTPREYRDRFQTAEWRESSPHLS